MNKFKEAIYESRGNIYSLIIIILVGLLVYYGYYYEEPVIEEPVQPIVVEEPKFSTNIIQALQKVGNVNYIYIVGYDDNNYYVEVTLKEIDESDVKALIGVYKNDLNVLCEVVSDELYKSDINKNAVISLLSDDNHEVVLLTSENSEITFSKFDKHAEEETKEDWTKLFRSVYGRAPKNDKELEKFKKGKKW